MSHRSSLGFSKRVLIDSGTGIWNTPGPEHEWMSPEFKALFGYEDHEIPNTPAWWQENIFPEDKEKCLKAFQAHIGPDRTPMDVVVRYHHRDGSTVWVRCRGIAKFNEQGVPFRMLGAHNDISDLMRAQQELKAQLHMRDKALEALTSTALDGYFDWDMQTGAEFLSDRWKMCLGYEPDEIENTHAAWEALLHPEDRTKATDAIRKHLDDGEPYNIVLRYRNKNDIWIYMRAQGVAQRHPVSGEWAHMFGTHTNVTDLFAARDQAKSANIAKSTFLATMSHEIRTPLNCLLGMAQSLQQSSLTDEQMDDLVTLQSAGNHLLSLLNDLLDFSRIEAGHLVIENEKFDVQETVASVLEIQAAEAQRKGLHLAFDTRIPPKSTFVGDSDRVRQIVFNLVGNAIKFTEEGSIEVQMVHEVKDMKSGIAIQVSDSGVGMTEEQQERIFNDFTQASVTTRRRYGGSGLGLSICKKLVDAMKGSINVTSKAKGGSTFTVWIPGLSLPSSSDLQSLRQVRSPILMYGAEAIPLVHCFKHISEEVNIAENEDELFSLVSDCDCLPENNCTIVLGQAVSKNKQLIDRLVLPNKFKRKRYVIVGRFVQAASANFPVGCKPLFIPRFPTSDEVQNLLSCSGPLHPPIESGAQYLASVDEPLKVLIAEDNRVNQKVLLRLLSRLPCEPFVVADGLEAVKACEQRRFDLILMDCLMPEMDGPEASRTIRKSNTSIPIVALTANASTDSRDECYASGMNGFLTKPVKLKDLIQIIKRGLATRDGEISIDQWVQSSHGVLLSH